MICREVVDLLRRAVNEHPVASGVIVLVELVAFFVVVSVVVGQAVVPYGAPISVLVAVLIWRRQRREAGPKLETASTEND